MITRIEMVETIKRMAEQMIKPVKNRVVMSISRAIIETAKDSDTLQVVKLNVLAKEDKDDIERFQNFGFSGVPPDGSEAIALAVGGNRDNLVIIAADDRRVRVKDLKEGESVQYNSKGDKWHIKDDGTIEGTSTKELKLTTPKVDFFTLKFRVSNGADDIVDLLLQMLTAINAEPFIVNKAVFALIKAKLSLFKV